MSRGSQLSFRSGKSETGILKNKGSPYSGSGQRRAKSMDEIKNNNALIFNSGSESDGYIDDPTLKKNLGVTADLRQRKPSLNHDHSHEEVKIEKGTTSANSESSKPVLEIIELDDRMTSVPFVKSSERFTESLEKLSKSSESLVNHSTSFIEPFARSLESLSKPSEPAVKCPESVVTGSIPFAVNLEDENKLENDGTKDRKMAKKDLVQRDADSTVENNKEIRSEAGDGEMENEKMRKNQSMGKSGDREEFLKENKGVKKTDVEKKLLKEDKGIKQANKVEGNLLQENNEGIKKIDNVKEKLLKESEEMKGKDEIQNGKKMHDVQPKENTVEQMKVVEEGMKNKVGEDRLRDSLEERLGNSKNIETNESRDVSHEQKDDVVSKNEPNDDEIKRFRKVEENIQERGHIEKEDILNKRTNTEQNLRQEIREDTLALDLDQKRRQSVRQSLKTNAPQEEREERGEEEPSGLNEGAEANSMGKQEKVQGANKELLLLDVVSELKDDDRRQRKKISCGSQGNVIDKNKEKTDSREEGNTRKRFHGIRLEPLSEVTKLTPPGSVV